MQVGVLRGCIHMRTKLHECTSMCSHMCLGLMAGYAPRCCCCCRAVKAYCSGIMACKIFQLVLLCYLTRSYSPTSCPLLTLTLLQFSRLSPVLVVPTICITFSSEASASHFHSKRLSVGPCGAHVSFSSSHLQAKGCSDRRMPWVCCFTPLTIWCMHASSCRRILFVMAAGLTFMHLSSHTTAHNSIPLTTNLHSQDSFSALLLSCRPPCTQNTFDELWCVMSWAVPSCLCKSCSVWSLPFLVLVSLAA